MKVVTLSDAQCGEQQLVPGAQTHREREDHRIPEERPAGTETWVLRLPTRETGQVHDACGVLVERRVLVRGFGVRLPGTLIRRLASRAHDVHGGLKVARPGQL